MPGRELYPTAIGPANCNAVVVRYDIIGKRRFVFKHHTCSIYALPNVEIPVL
jgi:hypothetical protein